MKNIMNCSTIDLLYKETVNLPRVNRLIKCTVPDERRGLKMYNKVFEWFCGSLPLQKSILS